MKIFNQQQNKIYNKQNPTLSPKQNKPFKLSIIIYVHHRYLKDGDERSERWGNKVS